VISDQPCGRPTSEINVLFCAVGFFTAKAVVTTALGFVSIISFAIFGADITALPAALGPVVMLLSISTFFF
jgi:hypothetical protein